MPETLTLPTFTLESGQTLREVPVAYQAWGRLNARRDNALIVCHALTGDTRVDRWWSQLLGPGRAFDPEHYFIVCLNVAASPYGTVSPITSDPRTGAPYGPDFPRITIRDTVRLHRHALERLGVRQAALAVGGSMGGMQALEWAFEDDFVRALAPIAVGGRHTAWQIGWSEAQRGAIRADACWQNGRYPPDAPPRAGLATARMMAMVSYRSHTSFGKRFGRERGTDASEEPPFAVESYLRYQGEKLADRFDANCYVRLTEQMDTHDLARGRGAYLEVLRTIRQPTLVVGIDTDVLYPVQEQEELATYLPNAELEVLASPHGHDAFLIEQETLNDRLLRWRTRIEAARVPAKHPHQFKKERVTEWTTGPL